VTPKEAFEWIWIVFIVGLMVFVLGCFAKALFSRE
jgi:hypothetical protein